MWDSKVFPKFIYIHWPFCSSKCDYCDFLSFSNQDDFQERYHKALCQEVKAFSASLDSNLKKEIATIFLGGGTPSLYPLNLLEDLFKVFGDCFSFEGIQEATIEVNPKGITRRHLSVWRSLGINRLSIGVQILDDGVLKGVERGQKVEDPLKLMEIAPEFFENISVDLILGLPGTTDDIWHQTLKAVTSWPIKHVSIYFLTIYENSPLYFKIQKGEVDLLCEEKLVFLYGNSVKYLKNKGFLQYEISNFSRPGFESLHNKAYWDLVPYKGFGLGASSYDGKRRFRGLKNLKSYLNCYSSSKISLEKRYGFIEVVDAKKRRLEELMLGLRQARGIDLHSMLYSLSRREKVSITRQIEDLKKKDLLRQKGAGISLTLKGMMLENEVILNLF